MSEEHKPEMGSKLTEAYNRMLERVRERVEEVEKDAGPVLRKAVDRAMETATELNELTREEAEKVGTYLKRDLEDAAKFVSHSGKELADWLNFDLHLVERSLADMVKQVVDRTTVELDRFAMQADALGEWHTGEVTGIGTLECKSCGERVHFHATAHVPPCPKCHGTRFRRISHEG